MIEYTNLQHQPESSGDVIDYSPTFDIAWGDLWNIHYLWTNFQTSFQADVRHFVKLKCMVLWVTCGCWRYVFVQICGNLFNSYLVWIFNSYLVCKLDSHFLNGPLCPLDLSMWSTRPIMWWTLDIYSLKWPIDELPNCWHSSNSNQSPVCVWRTMTLAKSVLLPWTGAIWQNNKHNPSQADAYYGP